MQLSKKAINQKKHDWLLFFVEKKQKSSRCRKKTGVIKMNKRSKLWIKAIKNALVNNDKILDILLKHCPLKSRHKLWIKIRMEQHYKDGIYVV